MLDLLGISSADAAAIAASTADPDAVEVYRRGLARATGDLRPFGRWPDPPDPLFYVHAFLAAQPDVRAVHAARGIPDDVSWATLADLGRQMAIHRRIFGRAGLHTHHWLTFHWRGLLVALGRLQYELHLRTGGEPVFGLHIPESGPLDPDAVDASLRRAADVLPRHFPEHRTRTVRCSSWLLDPQLAGHLPADSNIVAFQRRFTLVDEGREADRAVFEFVFRRMQVDLDVPTRTTLERAIVAHLRAGGHWRAVTGTLELPPPR